MSILIGLSGKKGSGKDTAADALVHDFGYERHAFASRLKAAVTRLDPIIDVDDEGIYRYASAVVDHGEERVKAWPEARRLLQRMGTEVGRDLFGDSFWVDQTMRDVDASGTPVVITDVRFPNEVQAIRERGGIVVRIERDGLPEDAHPSEHALDDYTFDVVIQNEGTVDEFKRDVSERLSSLIDSYGGKSARAPQDPVHANCGRADQSGRGMNFNAYQAATRSTAIYPEAGSGSPLALAYVGLGLGESGEVQGKIKKIIRDDYGVISKEKALAIAAEAGDLLWYVARLADELGIPLSNIAEGNLAKLYDRKNRNVLGGSGDER